MREEIRKEERTIVDEFSIYIAEDGKEFESKRECEKYEKQLLVEKYLDRELNDLIPIHYDSSFSDYNSYRWFKVNNKEEFDDLDEALSDNGYYYLHEVKTYPNYICLESEDDYELNGWNTDYNYNLDESMEIAKAYFDLFGIEVEFKRKE